MDYYKKIKCRLCQSTKLISVLKLTPTAIGNHFVTEPLIDRHQKNYPLELNFCDDCKHVQLVYVVDPEILYQQKYSYVSSTSLVFVDHLERYSQEILSRYQIKKNSLILDIGSNDGTSLSFFKRRGYRTLGIDPATEIVAEANKNGIETLCEFFSSNVAKRYVSKYGKAQLINSHNTCAHIDDLPDVIEGVKYWLNDDGLFVMEVGYLFDVIEHTWFDTIYHEHLDYHSLFPLVSFFKSKNMQIISVKRISPQGGSIRIIAQKNNGPYSIDTSVAEILNLEKLSGMNQYTIFQNFEKKIHKVKLELVTLIKEIKQKNKTIAGYGAPTKATTLLTHFGLGDKLDFLIDDNKLKQGLYSPGHHIPVYGTDVLYKRQPDYLVILAWNFAEDIMKKHQKYKSSGGNFIVPMPEVKIF